jgi:hypothetical protein
MSKFEEGQIVMVPDVPSGMKVGVVTKVGRKWGKAKIGNGWREFEFDIETGGQKPPVHGSGGHVYTMEEWAERERAAEINERFRAYGLSQSIGCKLTLNDFEVICDALDHCAARTKDS